ncbi:hypothetical protein VNI00_019481 [Paramarasmius palmivorus]|uniref:Ubiquitin-like protease family profile domain-containing protein n=1 Tax=Paramarasmius palmivorus TaxID=297713 RepID=A0AAW0AKT1_9AGAR
MTSSLPATTLDPVDSALQIPITALQAILPTSNGKAISPCSSITEILQLNTKNLPPIASTPFHWPDDGTLFGAASSVIDTPAKSIILRKQPMPTKAEIESLHLRTTKAAQSGKLTFAYPVSQPGDETSIIRLPLWAVSFWILVYSIQEHREVWEAARTWLQNHGFAAFVNELFSELPWQLRLPRAMGDVMDMARFLSDRWLNDVALSQLTELIRGSLGTETKICVEDVYWSNLMIDAYKKRDNGHSISRYVNTVGERLQDGTYTQVLCPVSVHFNAQINSLPVNRNGNHWVALAIDVVKQHPWAQD